MALKKFPIKQGSDDLLIWCAGYMEKVRTPKSPRDAVEAWYRVWRGKKEKPSTVKQKLKTHNVDRVAKWMKRQVKRNRLEPVDMGGKWQSQRYQLVDGMRLVRAAPNKPIQKGSEKTTDTFTI